MIADNPKPSKQDVLSDASNAIYGLPREDRREVVLDLLAQALDHPAGLAVETDNCRYENRADDFDDYWVKVTRL